MSDYKPKLPALWTEFRKEIDGELKKYIENIWISKKRCTFAAPITWDFEVTGNDLVRRNLKSLTVIGSDAKAKTPRSYKAFAGFTA